MFCDKQPRFGWCGVCHRALWQGEQLDFGLAAGAGANKKHIISLFHIFLECFSNGFSKYF